MYPATPLLQTPEDEIVALEDYKKEIIEEKVSIEQEITDLETRIEELKAKAEQGKSQQPGQ
jgi:predicted  nucleic acid-binding Zn-ribbon protein